MRRSAATIALVMAIAAAAAAEGPGTVSGVVRDDSGVVQAGTLVQLLGPASNVISSAWTDARGRYTIAIPGTGTFELRASASMFLPAVASGVALNERSQAVVNLTLSTLTNALQWLSAEPKPASQPGDDWKWTLRSSANRAILREFDGSVVLASGTGRTLESARPGEPVHAHTALLQQATFGDAGLHQVVSFGNLGTLGGDDSGYLMRADLAPSNSSSAAATMAYSHVLSPGETVRAAANYQYHNDTSGEVANALATATARFAEIYQLPDGVSFEAGNEVQSVNWGGHLLAMHPFARLSAGGDNGTAVTYTISTAPGLSSAADIDTTIERAVLASPGAHGLTLEHGLHQSLAFTHAGDKGTFGIAYFADTDRNPVLQGVATASALENSGLIAGYDPASGIFRETGNSFATQGVTVSATRDIGLLQANVTFVDANTLRIDGLPTATSISARPSNAQMTVGTVRILVPRSNTRLSGSYGEETEGVLHPLQPFGSDSPNPYLTVLMHQPIHGRPGQPGSLEALVDLRNLLAQGYHPFLSPDGETMYLVQVPRAIQGGLIFSF